MFSEASIHFQISGMKEDLMEYSHKSHNATPPYPHYIIQNRNVHISVLNGVLWDMGQVHCGICEYCLFT